MGYRDRIEVAVIALFDHDRQHQENMKKAFGPSADQMDSLINLDFCYDIALDLLCMPQDNTRDYDLNNPKDGHKWPKGCFCRDSYLDLWDIDAETGREFLDTCYDDLRQFAEDGDIFTKPKNK